MKFFWNIAFGGVLLFFSVSCDSGVTVPVLSKEQVWQRNMEQSSKEIPPLVSLRFSEKVAALSRPINVNELKNVQYFAFGQIGMEGVTSPGEVALHELMQNDSRMKHLDKLLVEGNPQARCYAIAAYRLVDLERYHYLLSLYENEKSEVRTCEGSIASVASFVQIIDKMRDQIILAPQTMLEQ